jgi:hypothetical protein
MVFRSSDAATQQINEAKAETATFLKALFVKS